MKLLCLTLVLGFSAATGWAYSPSLARIASAKTDLANLATALRMFKDDTGRYPTTDEGVAALVNRPQNVPPEKWHIYLEPERLPKDPWGHPYVYLCPGVHNTNTFDIYSYGPAGKTLSGGDGPYCINNWNPLSPLKSPREYEAGRNQVIRCVGGLAIFFLVLAMAWLNRRRSKSEGNLLGVVALLLLSATPSLLMASRWVLGANVVEDYMLVGFLVWVTALLVLTISGDNRGTPFGKGCARITIFLMLFLCLLAFFPEFRLLMDL
jgi:type II secretion system protein G